MSGEPSDASGRRRLDQWLWFTRLARSRSLAARLIAAGAVTLNDAPVRKANQAVRVGDRVAVPRGGFRHTVRVAALGTRRGPQAEARLLYAEVAAPVRLGAPPADWDSLFAEEEEGRDLPGVFP